jgi:septal ring factor EnvC (AmiA/AmiB activator)
LTTFGADMDKRKRPVRGIGHPPARWLTFAVVLAVGAGLSWSQLIAQNAPPKAPNPTPKTAEEAQRELTLKRSELEQTEKRAKSLQKDVGEIAKERERLTARLQETAALIQRSEAQLTTTEGRLGELEAQEKVLKGSLNQNHGQISHLLAALQRMGRNPPPVLITRREDALQMVRSAMLLAFAFPSLRNQSLALAERLNELVRVMSDIRSEGDKLRAETTRLNDSRTRLAGLLEERKQSLNQRQSELEEVRTAAAEISRNVDGLNELIVKLDKAVTNSTGLGNYNREQAADPRNAEPASPPPPPDAAIAGAPDAGVPVPAKPDTRLAVLVPPPKPPAVELAPAGTSLITGSPGRMKPAMPFHLAKARLPLPAQGRKVLAFGDKTQFGGNSKGIVLETRFGAQIVAPCDGWVVYAGEFRSYGQLLIINAGGGYHVLLAGLSHIDVQPGQFVLAAEPVGTMTSAGKSAQVHMQTNSPVLYVEFRKDGRPIDPDPWWVGGLQKVQG